MRDTSARPVPAAAAFEYNFAPHGTFCRALISSRHSESDRTINTYETCLTVILSMQHLLETKPSLIVPSHHFFSHRPSSASMPSGEETAISTRAAKTNGWDDFSWAALGRAKGKAPEK